MVRYTGTMLASTQINQELKDGAYLYFETHHKVSMINIEVE